MPEFHKQTTQPLFPSILFNRPVTRTGAGRILLLGGHSGEFSQPTAFHQFAMAAGAGECRVMMPDKLAPLLGGAPGVYFGASTASGSLARGALGRIFELAEETDVVAIGTSLSNNSDTTMLTERVMQDLPGSLVVFDDATRLAHNQAQRFAARPSTLFILTMPEVFKLCGALGIAIHIRADGGLINKIEIVHNLAAVLDGDLAVFGTEVIVASNGQLSVTPVNHRLALQPAVFWAVLSSFWVQNRNQVFAGLTTGAYVIGQAGQTFDAAVHPTITQLTQSIAQSLRAAESDW